MQDSWSRKAHRVGYENPGQDDEHGGKDQTDSQNAEIAIRFVSGTFVSVGRQGQQCTGDQKHQQKSYHTIAVNAHLSA